jgi:hypothetical protein
MIGPLLAILFLGLAVIVVVVAGLLILDACGIRPLLPKTETPPTRHSEGGRET